MRKLILITAMVLASAAAQAGERSLSLGGAASPPAATSNSVSMAGKVADAPAPQLQVQPAAQQAPGAAGQCAAVGGAGCGATT